MSEERTTGAGRAKCCRGTTIVDRSAVPLHPRRCAGRAGGWLASMALLLALPQAAHAHATWADGRPVPDWVAKACCGPADAHHLRADQVHRIPDGYRIDAHPGLIYDTQVLPSEDGEYWAFYSEVEGTGGDRIFTSVFCFFAPGWS